MIYDLYTDEIAALVRVMLEQIEHGKSIQRISTKLKE